MYNNNININNNNKNNKITLKLANKRIMKEIEYIEENMPTYQVQILDFMNDLDSNICNDKYIFLEIITPNFNILVLKIPSDYPFKPPLKVTLNGEDYRYKIKNMPNRINYLYYHPNDVYFEEKNKIKHFKSPKCLCCTSLLCGENWSPVCKISSILEEINQHNQLKNQIKYKLVLKPIFDKFGLPIDILRYLLIFL